MIKDIIKGTFSIIWGHISKALGMYIFITLPVWLFTIIFHFVSGGNISLTFVTISIILNSNLFYWHMIVLSGCVIVSSWTHRFDMW